MSTRTERMNDKSLNEKHAKILKELMAKPENKICVDCKKKDPRWASWNLGVFFCIRCSGIHRAMGTHISRVKSADLDTWTPEQIQSMLKWGNTKANWYWEHNVTYEPTDSNIEQWIRAKYERKMFARAGPIPDPDTIPVGGAQPSKAPASNPAPVQQQQHQVQSQAPPKPVQPQGADLFSIAQPPSNIPATSASAQQPQAAQQLASVFSNQGQQQGYHNFKNNILGLYSSPATTTTTTAPVNGTNMQQSQPSSFANFGSFSSAPQPQVSQSQPMNPSFAAFQSFQSSPPASSTPQIQQQQQNSFANFGSFQSAQAQPQPQNQSFASFASFQSAPQPQQPSQQPFGNFQNFTTQSTTQPSFAAFQSIPSTGAGGVGTNGMQMMTGQPPQPNQQNQPSKSPVQNVQGLTSVSGQTQSQNTNAFDGLDWGAFK